MNNQNVQQPLFAPVTQTNKFDGDIDLSDIFAEYLNEGTDPLTTFSNFGSLQMQQNLPIAPVPAPVAATNIMLPTGGIRTSFHAKNIADVNQGIMQQQQQQQNQLLQQQQQQQDLHIQKKARMDDNFQNGHQTHFQQQAAVPNNISTTGSGITGRLGFNLQGGQLTMPNPIQPAPVASVAPTPSPAGIQMQNGVQLPVGFGIRLGGVQSQVAQSGGITLSHVQHGTNKVAAPQVVGAGADQSQLWSAGNTPGGLSDHAMAERRQRNREHAKRSRVRKKFLLESLQAEVRSLQDENESLRILVQTKIPLHAQKIISECCAKNPLFEDSQDTAEKDQKDGVQLENSDFSLIASLTSGQQNFVLSDPRLPDNPIVYASEGFYQLTGYTREQVLGRNCRFLQGPGTDPRAVDVIRTAVANGTDATACILNYKADGTPFWNQFFVAALRDSDNCIVNYVGVQCAVDPEAGASALEDKVNSVLPLVDKEGAGSGSINR